MNHSLFLFFIIIVALLGVVIFFYLINKTMSKNTAKLRQDENYLVKINQQHIAAFKIMKKGAVLEIEELIYKGMQDLILCSTPEEVYILLRIFENELSGKREKTFASQASGIYLRENSHNESVVRLVQIIRENI
jgi:hypothetical protein